MSMSSTARSSMRRLPIVLSGLLVMSVLVGCGSSPKTQAPASLQSTVPPLERFMSDAARARQEGSRTIERDTYRKAAQAYPTSKEPWLKLAEGYFEAADYGNTILSAQEALQRDAADKVAASLLAVSGLRVSTAALASLRQGQDLNGDTRRQAEDVVKSLREVLGEPVLVPKPEEAPPVAPARRAAPRPQVAQPQAQSQPSVPAAKPAPKPTPAPVAAKPAPATAKPANPFDTLK